MRGEIVLKLYSDRSFLPPGRDHVEMLYPFWGKNPEDPSDPSTGRFDRYVASGAQFFEMVPLGDADLAILPGAWSHVIQNAEARRRADRFAASAREAGKQTIVFFNSDSTENVLLENAVVFRTSLYRSRKKPSEFALPAWSEDFVDRYLEGRVPVRAKRDKAVVGFCGFAAPLFRSWSRNILRWGASLAGLRQGETSPLVRPGHAIRLQAMRALEKSSVVATNFVVREHFFGGADPGGMQKARLEYVRNMVESDYTLCVRGAGNFSYRLYETLSCGRIPVFVDTDCVLPYASVIDWKDYCVYVDETDVGRIAEHVADFHAGLSAKDFEERQRSCRNLWKDYMSPEGYFGSFHRHFA